MPYTLQIDIYPDYVFFARSGVADYDEVLESWRQVARTCKEHGIKKVLAHTVNEVYLSTTNIYKIASGFRALGFETGCKVAHVFIGTEPESEGRFGETVAFNRGATYKVFDDLERARAWLLGSA